MPFPVCRNRCICRLAVTWAIIQSQSVEVNIQKNQYSEGARSGLRCDGRAALLWKRMKREAVWSILAQGYKKPHLNHKFSCHSPVWVTSWEAVGPHTSKPTQASNSFRQAASWLDLTACSTSGPAEQLHQTSGPGALEKEQHSLSTQQQQQQQQPARVADFA